MIIFRLLKMPQIFEAANSADYNMSKQIIE